MKLRPLKGQCLIEVLPRDELESGIIIPDTASLSDKGDKLPPIKGIIRAVGAWPQTKDGYCVLPDFVPGDRVLVSEYSGQRLRRNIGEKYRLVKVQDVLAVIS